MTAKKTGKTTARTKDTGTFKDRPYVENYPPLKEWLDRQEAGCNWQIALGDQPKPRAYIESWTTKNGGGAEVIVVVRADQMGWNIYTAHPSSSIASTLADADARLERPSSGELAPMTWDDTKHFIAQGAVNISEGLTTICQGSPVHRAMAQFCTFANEGMAPKAPEDERTKKLADDLDRAILAVADAAKELVGQGLLEEAEELQQALKDWSAASTALARGGR